MVVTKGKIWLYLTRIFRELIMSLEAFDIVIFGLGAIVGYGASTYFFKKTSAQETETTQFSTHSVQQDMDKKQHAIDTFFDDANMTLSQAEALISTLRSQLSNSAAELSSTKLTENINPVEKEDLEPENNLVEPPRDYAPKVDIDSPGMLSEEFGLSKEKEKSADTAEDESTSSAKS